jgi:hypothetical protein
MRQEWDYPPERRRRRGYDPDIPPPATGWASPTTTRIVDIYWYIVMTMVKVVLGGMCGLVLFGCIWVIVTILSP